MSTGSAPNEAIHSVRQEAPAIPYPESMCRVFIFQGNRDTHGVFQLSKTQEKKNSVDFKMSIPPRDAFQNHHWVLAHYTLPPLSALVHTYPCIPRVLAQAALTLGPGTGLRGVRGGARR